MSNFPSFKSAKYSVAPAGEDCFLIDSVDYIKEKNAIKVVFRMQKADRKHTEYYRLNVDFQVNALGNMLRAAYNNDTLEEFDEKILTGAVGRQFTGEIIHRTWDGNTYASINAFSYHPVETMFKFVKTMADVINDEDTEEETESDNTTVENNA